jgi:hypothetical protein
MPGVSAQVVPDDRLVPIVDIPRLVSIPLTYDGAFRWTKVGVGGRVLPSQKVGGRRYVRVGDLKSWLAGGASR